MSNRQRLAALIPLQMIIMVIAIRNIGGPDRVPQIAGWVALAGIVLTLAGYAAAWRREARPGD